MTKLLMILRAISLGKLIIKEGVALVKIVNKHAQKSKKLSDADKKRIMSEVDKIKKELKSEKTYKEKL